jgi:hypothetical protein
MIETVEELKKQRPDLVQDFEAMTKEELLEQVYLESIDAINMESRVQLFMNECTNMSKTNYTLDVIKTLISDKQEDDLNNWCIDLIAEYEDYEILEEIKNRPKQN